MSVSKNETTGKWDCSIWYKDWQGKRKHTNKRGFSRKKDAEAFEREFLSKQQCLNPTMKMAAEKFKEELADLLKLNEIKESTYSTKIRIVDKYIIPCFENKKVADITANDITKWMAYLSANAQQRERLGSKTLIFYRSILNQIFVFCQKNYNLERNPVKLTSTPKPYTNDKRPKFWTLEEYQKFYDTVTSLPYKVFFNVIFWAGLRIGEALALTPADIMPYKLHINKNIMLVGTNQVPKLSTPKNNHSIRNVEIPRYLYNQIQGYIELQYHIKATDFIFAGITHQNARDKLIKFAKLANLTRITPHILRHSYASILYSASHDITVVAKQIGHADINTTFKVYAHMLPDKDRQAIDNLEVMALNRKKDVETHLEPDSENHKP